MLQLTQTYLSVARCGEQGLKRKAAASMVRIMHEVVRESKRAILRRATAITVSLNDRGGFRVVRFLCVSPGVIGEAAHSGAGASGDPSRPDALAKRMLAPGTTCVFTGILAVLRRGGCASTETLADLQEDYSLRMRDSVLLAIDMVCTSIMGALDTSLAEHVRAHILTYLSDGAASAQKRGKLLQDKCRHLVLVLRDTAHTMRKSCEEPIKNAEGFGEIWEDIFNKRRALVPDIQHSHAWQAKLLMAQRHVLECKGSLGAGLKRALKHLSFAKQRFDSAACPARKFCALLSPIAILLATVAADSRVDGAVRRRAQSHLDNLTPERIAVAGMFADYSAEVLQFVRLFDSSEHDPAHTLRQARHFLRRIQVLFAQGHVLVEMPPGAAGETCTTMAVTQAREFGKLYYLDRCINLWPPNARSGVERALASMADVVTAVSDRVDAEVPRDSLQADFGAFDLRAWHVAFNLADAGNVNDAELALAALRRRVRALSVEHPFCHEPAASTVPSLEAVVKLLRRAYRDKMRSGEHNKELWSLVVSSGAPNAEPSAGILRLLNETWAAWSKSWTCTTTFSTRTAGTSPRSLSWT